MPHDHAVDRPVKVQGKVKLNEFAQCAAVSRVESNLRLDKKNPLTGELPVPVRD